MGRLPKRALTGLAVLAIAGASLIASPASAEPAAATLPPPSVTGPTTVSNRSVFVIGDSVLLGAGEQIRTALTADGWQPTIATFPGLPLRVGMQALAENRYRISGAVVIHLGNNLPDRVDDFRRQVDQTMQILSGVDRVIWLNIQPFAPNRSQLDQILNEAAGRWPNMVVADWAGLVASHPGYTTPTNPHLSGAGRVGMTNFIRDQLTAVRRTADRCAPSSTPPRSAALGSTAKLWVLDSAGAVHGIGVVAHGDFPGRGISTYAAIGIAATARGYWIADAFGRVEAFGDAPVLGDLRTVRLSAPITRIVATGSGRGYWMLGRDGGVFSFGDAGFNGSLAGQRGAPAVDLTPNGNGYWLTAADGAITALGTAPPPGDYRPGSTVSAASGNGGIWMLDAFGGVFSRGTAFRGSFGNEGFCVGQHAVAIASTHTGDGYWVATDLGAVVAFGDAAPMPDPIKLGVNARVVALAPAS